MAFINENIKKLRIAKGYKQDELGDQFNRKRGTVSKIENGSTITLEDAIKISNIFQVPLDDLVNSDIDVMKVVETKKIELSHYNIKSIHPFLDSEYKEMPEEVKEFGKALTVEVFKEFKETTSTKLRQDIAAELRYDISTEIVLEYRDIITNKLKQHGTNKQDFNKIEEIMIECSSVLLSNHNTKEVEE